MNDGFGALALNILTRSMLIAGFLPVYIGLANPVFGQMALDSNLSNNPGAAIDTRISAIDMVPQDDAMEIVYKNAPQETGNALVDYLRFYFPDAPAFDPTVPLPHEILGFAPGELHITPETLHAYVKKIADSNPRISIKTVGQSHERRPLTNLYISSPENISNLEQIRQRHLNATSPSDDILVLKLAYSIHGNEPSGSNAVPLIAYYLAASQDPWVQSFLARTVVIIEPVQNPDGLTRFAQWANSHRSETINIDPAQRNHHASWPSGRTNHYWFDLNRDWIFTVHPESKSRIREYYQWKPHVLGDFHEMGGNKPSYFFQPGHPKRTHPFTLDENQKITTELAKYHAKALDKTRQDYFTQERFDDFYYGKGSAYPDVTGGIGLLFEQVAVRGIYRDFGGERVSFRQSIANHITTSFSLMRGSDEMRRRIMDYRFFYRSAEAKRARTSKNKAYVFSDDGDPERARALADILAAHKIKSYRLARKVSRNGLNFYPGAAWVVPAAQENHSLITSLFELRTSFADNVFYDISTWNLPLAFNLPFAPLGSSKGLLGTEFSAVSLEPEQQSISGDATAYAIRWNQLEAPRFLQALLEEGALPRVAAEPFEATRTLILRMHDPKMASALKKATAKAPSVKIDALSTGLTPNGPDLGSRDMDVIYPVKAALIVGRGVTTTEAGDIWHLFDKIAGIPLTFLDIDRVKKTNLSHYTHILMANGSYSGLDDAKKKLKDWIKQGGTLVAQKKAARWAFEKLIDGQNGDGDEQGDNKKTGAKNAPENEDAQNYRVYGGYQTDRGDRLITGAVFNAEIDNTHPFAFGYTGSQIPVFRTWDKTLERSKISYDMPVRYTNNPLKTGFASKKKIDELKGTPAIALHRMGDGFVVALADNLNFRGFWKGTNKLYLNILYFAQTVDKRDDEEK